LRWRKRQAALRGHNGVMERKVIGFVTDKRFVRRAREVKTIDIMIAMYCRAHHGTPLCDECTELSEYARRRTERCVFGDAKPTCANCLVHCYSHQMRERIRMVMRWSGPRMLVSHPILGIAHKLDGLRPSPRLPER
jgi:hypothetical protein